MRHVFETMGTVASIELPRAWASEVAALERIFREVDDRFSLYRRDSELSMIADGRLLLSAASSPLLASYSRALEWRNATGCNFSPHRPDGAIDLNGIVKAEAIDQAGAHLTAAGCPQWSINVGGDILISPTGGATGVSARAGQPAPAILRAGIADPATPAQLLCSLELRHPRRAIATSGSAQRGDHIWRGGSTEPAQFVQVSVVANDIVTADVLATTIVAGGEIALDDVTDRWDVDVITVDAAGALRTTPGLLRSLASSP
ncbi:FAD:protein FMN transferase [Salinibacterium sp. M195]|uniref:FAD:protein FMN transferase n=1 Tax=Salinibacterium sp. M195 TaxID=2583374 RepID=UPI0021042173|nr:FAD:protein FMN transferase [Salinibacterium sp. M195]QYH34657.1 FAD:protein FMN transferase [Salinibacterium sp. M195]